MIILRIMLAMSFVFVFNHGFCLDAYGNPTEENNLFKVVEANDPAKSQLSFIITDKINDKQRQLSMTDLIVKFDIVHYNSIALYRDKLVLLDSNLVTIVDLNTNNVVDQFVCYSPEISSNNRFIVFRKFFSRYAPDEATSLLLLIYDIEKKPEDNRYNKEIKSDSFLYFTDVGLPIYPAKLDARGSYDIWVDDPEERRTLISKIVWRGNSQEIIFAERKGMQFNSLIIVDMTDGVEKLKTKKIDIAIESLMKKSDNALDLQKAKSELYLQKMELLDGKIRLEVSPKSYFKQNKTELIIK